LEHLQKIGIIIIFLIFNHIRWNLLFFKFLKKQIWKRILQIHFGCAKQRLEMSKKVCFFHPYYSFHCLKTLHFIPFSIRLHLLNKILITSHIQILKIEICNKYLNLLLYKILVYKIYWYLFHPTKNLAFKIWRVLAWSLKG